MPLNSTNADLTGSNEMTTQFSSVSMEQQESLGSSLTQTQLFTQTTVLVTDLQTSSAINCQNVTCNEKQGFINSTCHCQCFPNFYGDSCENSKNKFILVVAFFSQD
jgi:hypothetical protein